MASTMTYFIHILVCDLDLLYENSLSGFTFKKYDDHAIYFLVEFVWYTTGYTVNYC